MARFTRNSHGIPQLNARDDLHMYELLGDAHGTDRALQILITRILAEGRASELLNSDDELLEIDRFFRSQDWLSHETLKQEALNPTTLAICEAYCKGLNAALEKNFPWELKLMGVPKREWDVSSMLTMMRLIGFIGMAQSQSELELMIIEMVKNNVPVETLEELFPGHLEGLDVELIKKLKCGQQFVPAHIKWLNQIPSFLASNNWAVRGSRTQSGKAIFANDPHMEITRLPNIWSEMNTLVGERWGNFMTMPGLPAFIIGRTPDLAWGATYTYMDAADSWIEEIKDGKYRHGNEWKPLLKKTEIIKRKGKAEVALEIVRTHHGRLDRSVDENGFYLATKWSCEDSGHRSINSMHKMWRAKNVQEGMSILGELEPSFNWVFADREGNIGYQMSGLLPVKKSGVRSLAPLKGFDPEDDWQGYHRFDQLPRDYNPDCGYIVTANQDLNHLGKVPAINACMGSYRADRIAELIEAKGRVSVDDCRKFQTDLYSLEAKKFLEIIKTLPIDSPNFHHLLNWDLCFDKDSVGAFYFEKFHRELYLEIFSTHALGADVVKFLQNSSSILNIYYENFNRIFLAPRSKFFGSRTRDEIFTKILEGVLREAPQTYQNNTEIYIRHMLFGGKLPLFLGFDRGPYYMPGSRATPSQGQKFMVGSRLMSFAAAVRFVTDFAEEATHTIVVGGPSDRRFSRYYNCETARYFSGELKTNMRMPPSVKST